MDKRVLTLKWENGRLRWWAGHVALASLVCSALCEFLTGNRWLLFFERGSEGVNGIGWHWL